MCCKNAYFLKQHALFISLVRLEAYNSVQSKHGHRRKTLKLRSHNSYFLLCTVYKQEKKEMIKNGNAKSRIMSDAKDYSDGFGIQCHL